MKVSTRVTDMIVGAFVVLGIAAIVGATSWARQAHLGRGQSNVTARFHNMGSAGVGTNAYVRGVRAGRVSAVELGDDGWVRARIALETSVHLPDDPVVVLGSSSLVGDWEATIMAREAAAADPDMRRQLDESSGERGVIPGATLPDVRYFITGAGHVLEDVGAVAGHARVAFDDQAARELRAAIANASALSASLAVTSEAVRRTALRADSVSAAGDVQRTVHDVAAAAADLRATASELHAFTGGAGDTRVTMDRLLARVDTLVARTTAGSGTVGRAMNDPSLYAGTDSLVAELRALVADLKAHPTRYLSVKIF